MVQARLTESAKQIEALRRGLGAVFPLGVLSLLTWREARETLCGTAEINVDLLKAHTRYSQWSAEDEPIQWLWAILRSFSDKERAQFLRFVSGRERLPQEVNPDADLMLITRQHGPPTLLPKASTCFNTFYLPAYSSLNDLRSKLLLAIGSCHDIDIDFHVRDDGDFFHGDDDDDEDDGEQDETVEDG